MEGIIDKLMADIKSDKWGRILGLILVVFQFGIMLVSWWRLPPQIPLWFSRAPGVNQLENRIWLWLIPGCSVAVWLIYLALVRLKVNSSLYVACLQWLELLIIFLFTISLGHIINLFTITKPASIMGIPNTRSKVASFAPDNIDNTANRYPDNDPAP